MTDETLKPFLIGMVAIKFRRVGIGVVPEKFMMVGLITAPSEAEAAEQANQTIREKCPPGDGWEDYGSYASELPREVILANAEGLSDDDGGWPDFIG